MKYRADIDGLRAVAVAPVVLFHAGFEIFSGGFVGVDVFFVISGYLITGIILDEMRAGQFSVLGFYERRARRILPALFVVMAFTLTASWFLLLPIDYQSLAKSALATTAFASNLYFWRQAGYFAGPSDMVPLLHTWSLSVEEQFYIGFPLIMLLLLRWKQKILALITIGATLASFALSVWAVQTYPSAAFYLIPTRAWELSLGALLALGVVPAARSRPLREVVGLLGLLLIVVPVFTYTEATVFPGLAALPPCLGTAAIIWAGMGNATVSHPNIVSRLLGLAPVVFMGLISYSLYLWHWPLLVLARHLTVSESLDQPVAIAIIVLATVAAIASWRFIERPFRNRSKWGRVAVFTAAGSGAATLAAASLVIIVLQGVPSRFDPTVVKLAERGLSKKAEACLNGSLVNGEIMPTCILGRSDEPVEFVVWGDSHAAAIMPAFDVLATRLDVTGGAVAFNACPALTGIVSRGLASSNDRRSCWENNKNALDYIRRSSSVRIVILSGFWTSYLRNPAFFEMSSDGEEVLDSREGVGFFLDELEGTIERLTNAGKQVVILDNLPEPGFTVPWTLAMSAHLGRPAPVALQPESNELSERMRAVFERFGVIEIAMDQAICADGVCKLHDGENNIFKDGNHLSEFGATEYYAPFLHDRLFKPYGALQVRATISGKSPVSGTQ